MGDVHEREIAVDRGTVVLRYLEAGQGRPMVMLPGWSQTAELYRDQVRALSHEHRVIALDHRGHGRSDAPDVGYHVHRVAADLHDVLTTLDLRDVTLLAHSMGCAVSWAYTELFGTARLDSLVLIDQMASVLRNPAWSDEEAEAVGAIVDVDSLFGFTNGLRNGGDDPRVAFLEQVTSEGIHPSTLDRLIEQNLLFDRVHAAGLLFDTASFDWRDAVEVIGLPTLIISGDSVNVPIRSQQWLHEHIGGSQFTRMTARSGGTHFPFVENPDAFTKTVATFLASRPSLVAAG